jgi:hypothetical protein
MDTLDRVFLGTAAAGVAVLVALTLLLSVASADPVPATVLQVLSGVHPAAALGRGAGQPSAAKRAPPDGERSGAKGELGALRNQLPD